MGDLKRSLLTVQQQRRLMVGKRLPLRPEEMLEQIRVYRTSGRMASCQAGYEVINELLNSTRWSPGDRALAVMEANSILLDSCLSKPAADLPLASLVFLTVKDPSGKSPLETYCLGFNFRDNLVLTAKHCVVDPRALDVQTNMAKAGNRTTPIPLAVRRNTRAFLLDGSTRMYGVHLPVTAQPQTDSFDVVHPEDDVAIVALSDFDASGRKSFTFEVAGTWEQLNFVWPNISGQLIQEFVDGRISAQDFQSVLHQTMYVDDSFKCRVASQENKCLSHACDSQGGLSGSPLLAVRGNSFSLVGVHTGSIGAGRPPCDLARTEYFPNYGLALPRP